MAQVFEKCEETQVSELEIVLSTLHERYVNSSNETARIKSFNDLYGECWSQIYLAKTVSDLELIMKYCPEGCGIIFVITEKIKEMAKLFKKNDPNRIEKATTIKSIVKIYSENSKNSDLKKASIPKLEKLCENDGIASADFDDLCHLYWDFDGTCGFHALAKKLLTRYCYIDVDKADIKKLAIVFKYYPGDDESYRNSILRKAKNHYLDKITKESLAYKIAEYIKSFSNQFITSIQHIDAEWSIQKIKDVDELCLAGCKKIKTADQLNFYLRLVDDYISHYTAAKIRLKTDELDGKNPEWLATCTLDELVTRVGGNVKKTDVSWAIWNRYVKLCLIEIDKLSLVNELNDFVEKYGIHQSSLVGRAIRKKKLVRALKN